MNLPWNRKPHTYLTRYRTPRGEFSGKIEAHSWTEARIFASKLSKLTNTHISVIGIIVNGEPQEEYVY